jgi:GGDEF domain-containing protein
MADFDQAGLDQLERREFQLLILTAVVVLVLAGGVALLMYPVVFVHPDEANKFTLRIAFVGFCVLTILFVGYLFDRKRTVHKLKQHLLEEMKRNDDLRDQANAALLRGLPDLSHFHDQLAMEFRRASSTQRPLSIAVVKVNLTSAVSGAKDKANSLGEGVKAMARNIRQSHSMYQLGDGIFGIVMPNTDLATANSLSLQIEGTLKAIGGSNRFTAEITTRNYPEQVESSHELEQVVSEMLPTKSSWAEVASLR